MGWDGRGMTFGWVGSGLGWGDGDGIGFRWVVDGVGDWMQMGWGGVRSDGGRIKRDGDQIEWDGM